MAKNPTVRAFVEEERPNAIFLLKLEDGRQILAHMSGRMRHNHIRVLVGDTVDVWLDPMRGKTTNRIERRV